jgi:hypothetical protein
VIPIAFRERLDFLADNPLYTKRFAYYVAAPPIREKSACRRTTDRARAAACDRTSPSARDRSRRKPFF